MVTLKRKADARAVVVELSENSPKWQAIFDNARPIHVEIGPGKGQFLMEVADRHPHINFVGIEIRRKRVVKIASKVQRTDLTNIRIVHANAKEKLSGLFMPASVSAFYILFPDPWPKRCHENRRFFDADSVEALYQCLMDNGKIFIATDVEYYAQRIEALLCAHHGFSLERGGGNPIGIETIHEWKFKLRGREIYYLCCSKSG